MAKVGRPPSEDRRLSPMGFRPTAELRERLEAASQKSGKSLSWEIEWRLMRSFLIDDLLGKRDG